LCDGMLAMFLTSSYLKISLNFDVLKLKIHFLVGLSVSVCHVEDSEFSRVDHIKHATWNNDESSQCRFCHVEESQADHLPSFFVEAWICLDYR